MQVCEVCPVVLSVTCNCFVSLLIYHKGGYLLTQCDYIMSVQLALSLEGVVLVTTSEVHG